MSGENLDRKDSHRRSLDSHNGNIIFLPELLRCFCDGRGGLIADSLGSLEAIQITLLVSRFDHAIG